MTTILIVDDLKFAVESDGFTFRGAEADRDAGIEAIRNALLTMPAERLAALHAATLAWIDADCDGERPAELTTLERIGETIATAGWARPDAAALTLSAKR